MEIQKTRRIFFLVFAIILLTISNLSLAYTSESLTLFTNSNAAQQHCPNDEVVWLNLPTGIWHTKWQRWYGRTKHGAYVCRSEAAAVGYRASMHG